MSNYSIQINSITCKAVSDPSSKDEVWFFYQPDGGVPVRYPYGAIKTNSMGTNDIWDLTDNPDWPPVVASFDHDLQITLWDQDLRLDVSLTDFLGNLDITPSSTAGNSPELTNGDSSGYIINWKWVS